MTSTYILLIAAALLVQTLLIIGLQRSRSRHKRAKAGLTRSQQELEQRVLERTTSLHTINKQLYDEIAKHEITEELLHETQDYLHSIINSMPSMLIGLTREGSITHWNSAAEQTTGILAQDALGQPLGQIYQKLPITLAELQAVIDEGQSREHKNIQFVQHKQAPFYDLSLYPLISEEITGAVIRIDDVSLRVRMENAMIQNEKMMSLGEMAAGMAHEINNPLSAILNTLQNIERRLSPRLVANRKTAEKLELDLSLMRKYLKERDILTFIATIRDAGERSARIVNNLLEFSRNTAHQHSAVDLTTLLEYSLELADNTFGLKNSTQAGAISIERDLAADLPSVNASAPELQQVILNLLLNASQAFDTPGYLSQEKARIGVRTFQQGPYVCFEITDNGPGMEAEESRHIFEPFFTTKEVGQGTGLGLSVSYFIITEQHKGRIEVDSTPGVGTRFTIKLPSASNTLTAN